MSNMTPSERKNLEASDKKRMQLKEKLKMERDRHEEVLLKLQKEFIKKKSIDDELHLNKIKSMQDDMEKNSAEILKILAESESKRGGMPPDNELLKGNNGNTNTIQQAMKKRN